MPGSKFSTWLYTIAHNVAANAHRTLARRREVHLAGSPGDSGGNALEAAAVAASGLMPARLLDKSELRDVVKVAVAALNERQREAVLLNKFEHLSYEEIAQVMNLSVSAVKSLLTRAEKTCGKFWSPTWNKETESIQDNATTKTRRHKEIQRRFLETSR